MFRSIKKGFLKKYIPKVIYLENPKQGRSEYITRTTSPYRTDHLTYRLHIICGHTLLHHCIPKKSILHYRSSTYVHDLQQANIYVVPRPIPYHLSHPPASVSTALASLLYAHLL